jgi:hypothetical protein
VLARGDGTGALRGDAVELRSTQRPQHRTLWIGQRAQRRHTLGVGVEQRLLRAVPLGQQIRRGRTPDQAWVDDARKAHAGHVPRGGEDAVEVPYRLGRVGEAVDQEAATVLPREDTGEAPLRLAQRADLQDVDDQQVTRLDAVYVDRAAQDMHVAQVHVAHVVGAVVVCDLPVGPVQALDSKALAEVHGGCGGDVRVPAVVQRKRLLVGLLGDVYADLCIWHSILLSRLRIVGIRPAWISRLTNVR